MVFTVRRFILSYALLFVLIFSVLFSTVITLLRKEKAGLYASREFVCLSCMHYLFCLFVFLWVSGVGCGLLLWHSLDFSFNFLTELDIVHAFIT